jgi:hypothetical protein
VPDSARDESAFAFIIARDTADSADTSYLMCRSHDKVSVESILSLHQGRIRIEIRP